MPTDLAETCPHCLKPRTLCVCDSIKPIENKLFVLILQHPQEQDRELGTARMALRHFARGKLAIGLSWPNLTKALGRNADPKRWGVLYLGSAQLQGAPEGYGSLVALDREGQPMANQAAAFTDLDGIVLLDGSWSQAKALWWRNAWLLKLRRLVLIPARPSRYGRLRKEPRRESVSTLEAAALAMSRLENRPDLGARMILSFEEMLGKYRAAKQTSPTSEPPAPAD